MKTELQLQFEDQTPTIRGRSTVEYLQTFVSWLHLQVEKLTPEISDQDKIKMYLKRYPNIMMKGFSGSDLRQAYFGGIEDTITKGGRSISDEDVGRLVKGIAYTQHHEEQSEDFIEKVWIVKEWLQDLPKTVSPLTEGREKRNLKKNPPGEKSSPPPPQGPITKDTLYRKIYCEKGLPDRDGKYNTDLGELYLTSDKLSRKWRSKTGLGYVGVYYPEWWLEEKR